MANGSACGGVRYVDGGVIQSASIVSSQIVNSSLENSAIRGCSLENTTSVDRITAEKIAAQLATLDQASLNALATALNLARSAQVTQNRPAVSTEESLSTTVLGNRDMLLGRPTAWGEYADGYIIPLFTKAV